MSTARQRRRGTTAQHASFTGLVAELTVDTDKHVVVVHDGATAGGFPLALASSASPVETQIHAATGKTTPVDADEIGIVDSAASNVLKKLTWANAKATIWTALGALISGGTGKTTPVDADTFVLSDSAASSATKKLTWANVKATLNTYFSGLGSLAIVAGDIVYGSATGVLSRLAKGTDGQFLSLVGGLPAWATVAAGGATARNRIVNPSMQISSINGNTSGTTNNYAPADNWFMTRNTSAGTITAQRVQSATAAGSKDRARITITVADSSLAAGEFLTFTQNLIGQEVADLLYGTASAKNIVLRFGFKGPAGTYAVHIGNSAANRSYVALFTISAPNANTDTVQTLSIPGDTTGTWLTDTGIGLTLDFVLACGSTFQGTTGWQSGNLLGTSAVNNGMGTLSSVFEIFDVGLYADPSATGVAPTFETPSPTLEVQKAFLGPNPAPVYGCRAWVNFNGTNGAIRAGANIASVVRNSAGDYTINFITPMPDANYAVIATTANVQAAGAAVAAGIATSSTGAAASTMTTSAVRITTQNDASAQTDTAYVQVAIFR